MLQLEMNGRCRTKATDDSEPREGTIRGFHGPKAHVLFDDTRNVEYVKCDELEPVRVVAPTPTEVDSEETTPVEDSEETTPVEDLTKEKATKEKATKKKASKKKD